MSGSEAALLSISEAKIKELDSKKNSKSTKILLKIKQNLNDYITTIVILNNLINIVGSIYVGVLTSKILGDIYLGIVSGILTFLIIIFAEIIPKIYGGNYSDKISMKIAIPLYYSSKILKPIIIILNKIINIFIKEEDRHKVSEGEIKEMVAMGEIEGSINSYERNVINKVFKMDDLEVYDIMVPKSEIVFIFEDSSFKEIVNTSKQSGFTRFPVFSKTKNEVIGIINVKDLLKFYDKEDKFSVNKILRPIIYVPDNMKLSDLENRFKEERVHMAAIVNEHGDFIGIVTLEDIIEELIGEIEDEFDKTSKEPIIKITDKKYHIDANTEISYIKEKIGIDLSNEDNSYSTLNGFLLYNFGKIPKVNEYKSFDNFKVRIIKSSKKKVLEAEFIVKETFED
jgi:CBS domain containing-hemolysin-like protein